MMLQRTVLLFTLLLASVNAGRIKGVSNPRNTERRLKSQKKKLKGPQERSCDIDSKRDEVKFECRTRSANSKDNSGSKDSSSDTVDVASDERQDRGISIQPDAEINDKIKYKIKTQRDGIAVELEYKNEIEMDDAETETKTKFKLLFQELVEYIPNTDDDSKAYDWESDEVVQRIPLTEWLDIPEVNDDGVEAYFTATTFAIEGGSVDFNFTISRAAQGERITANSMKIDVHILDFPWSRTDSYVALLSTLESEKKVKVDYDREAQVGKGHKAKDVSISFGEDMEDTFGFSTYGQYTWVEQAEATGGMTADTTDDFNGTVAMARQGDVIPVNVVMVENTTSTIEVIATSPANAIDEDNIQRIAYSFVGEGAQGASDIYWDPEAGVGYESGVGRSGVVLGLVGTAIVALFSVLV